MTDLPRATTVPAVVDAILAAFRSIDDVDLEVQDGPRPKPQKRKCIAVGVGREAVTEVITPEQRRGGWVYHEAYDVGCVLWSWGAKTSDQKVHRDNCGDLFSEVRSKVDELNLVNAPQGITFRLGAEGGWVQSYSGEGRACEKAFSVHVEATV
jgi:hypothetical protein